MTSLHYLFSTKNCVTLLDLCVSSLRRGHANLLCIVPILTDDPRRESRRHRQPCRTPCQGHVRRGLGATKGVPDRHAGRDVPSRMHTKVPTARHPYTCGSIPQHNTLQHPGSMEPMLCKTGLPSKAPSLNKVFADGHTASNAPDLFRPPKLSGAGPG